VASAVVARISAKTVRLPNKASIFRAELYAVTLAMDLIRRSKDTKFVIFSDSMSSLETLNGFKMELNLVFKIIKYYSYMLGMVLVSACLTIHSFGSGMSYF